MNMTSIQRLLRGIATIALLFSAVVALRRGPTARGLLGASALGGALLLATGIASALGWEGDRLLVVGIVDPRRCPRVPNDFDLGP